MKKAALFGSIFLGIAVLSLFPQNSRGVRLPAGPVSLDMAIELTVMELGETIPRGKALAVIHFKADFPELPTYIMEDLSSRLVQDGRLKMVSRNNNEIILEELKLHESGEVSDETVRSIGKKQGAEILVTGSLVREGNNYRWLIEALNVETAVIEASVRLLVNEADVINRAVYLGRTGDEEIRRYRERQRAKTQFTGIGVSAGSSFTAPLLIVGLGGAFSFLPYTFVDAGFDAGFIYGYKELQDAVGYVSLYPSARVNGYLPFEGIVSGIYLGAGGGYMMALYYTDNEESRVSFPVFDFGAGIHIGGKNHYLKLGYSLRTTFKAVNHKIAIGYSYRFE